MATEKPTAIVLGGINGAGKSTSAKQLLANHLAITTFVNADEIARGLSAFATESVAFEAGRVMLRRLEELAEKKADFAFESTLSGRTYISFIKSLRAAGYAIEIYYFWLRAPEIAVERVQARVRRGGHNIPESTIRSRYGRSVNNFWNLYRHLADAWYVYDNSGVSPHLLAAGTRSEMPVIGDEHVWSTFLNAVNNATKRIS